MRKRKLATVSCLLIVSLLAAPTCGQRPFRDALVKKYGFKSASCIVCHPPSSELTAVQKKAKNSKQFRNEFGKQFDKLLKDSKTMARLKEVLKPTFEDEATKAKVVEQATKEFLEALKKVELVKSPTGPTYDELLKKGQINGIKLAE